MKTIAELNEKWYWRFVKVVFIVFVVLCFLLSIVSPVIYIQENTMYNPEKIESMIREIEKKKEERNIESALKWKLIKQDFPDIYVSTEDLMEFFKKHNITKGKEIEQYLTLMLVQNKIL